MRKNLLWLLLAFILLVIGLAWIFIAQPVSGAFPISSSDQPVSWSLPRPQDYATNGPKVLARISQLKSEAATSTNPADLYVDAGNEYLTLGDGQNAYHAYEQAIIASSSEVVAYDDLGALFARLHATSTALRAYAKAVALSPSTEFYQLAYINYLALVAPTASSTATAFAAAGRELDNSANYLIAKASWLGSVGSTTAAIATWQEVRAKLPSGAWAAIDAQIARLEHAR